MKTQQVLDSATNRLMAYLRDVPFVQVERIEKEPRMVDTAPDFIVKLRLPDGGEVLVIGEVNDPNHKFYKTRKRVSSR